MPCTPEYFDQQIGTSHGVYMDELRKIVTHTSYAGDPTSNVTPAFVGQICHDTANDDWYIAHGTANTAWKIMAT